VELRERLLLSALLLAAQAGLAASPRVQVVVQPQPLPQLQALVEAGAAVTALAVDLETGRTIAELNAATALTPASLSKVFVAAAALQTFSPDHTFRTQLLAATLPRAELLAGDLVLRGSGDTTLDEQALWGLAAQLRGMGIRRIGGRILVERAPFGELGCDTVDRCAGQRRSSRAYNAAPSAIGVNYGSWCLAIRPTRAGQAALLRSCGAVELPIPLVGSVLTGPGSPRVERSTEGDLDRLGVGGSIPVGEERHIHRAMSDPALGAGLLLRSVLGQLGVVVSGPVETTGGPQAGLTELAGIEGLPLAEVVGRMMRYSNNYIADVMTMNVALARQGPGQRTLAEASRTLVAGVAGAPLLLSGSGLTTENRVSAQSLVDTLTDMYRDTRRFPAFYGALVVPHDAPFAYLRGGDPAWQDRVALKTGSLSEPVPVYGLAGYLRKQSGGFIAFAMLVNGTPRMPDLGMDRSLRAMRGDLTGLLAQY
jgi:D-alanyl-D-alanine carboxypeptidase/D-alanyl-D-alanine-endopeptidase (penicillin-binding protein 4)